MSEEQAIESNDEIIEEVTEEVTEEVEIVVTGEDTPASKVPYGLRKRFNKLNGKISAANDVAEEANRKANMLEEENRLLRLSAQSTRQTSKPDEDDFETTAEYETAQEEYDNTRIAKIAKEQAAQIIQASQAQTTQVSNDAQLEASLSSHYTRADTLKMANYEDLEDKAIDVLGNDLAKIIMAKTEKSHLIMAHLGANPAKAEELVELVKSDPVGALVKAVEIGNTLSIKPKNNIPDPETKIDPGSPASDWQSRLDSARDKATTSGNMDQILAIKREAKDAGITLR